MAAKWTSYYKIIEPKPSVSKVTDNQQIGDQGAYGNFSWYQRLVQGAASRLTRYREYDLMDNDVEVARALDTLAEEMTGNNPKTDEPLKVTVDSEKEEEISSSTVITLKTALKYWSDIHDWESRLFKISRAMVKYGDCFFRKNVDKPKERWQYIHPKNIVGALVDEHDVTKVLGWQIKKNAKKVKSSYGVPVSQTSSDVETELVPADEVIRFTLNDDMSDAAPFGDSVLGPVYRAHKQKELLEDAIIIYRIQRAPERRAFYIDVGKMPPQRVKTYLEQIKNEIKQKKVPNIHGGQQDVDSVYNPQSMCLALDTEIPLLDGRTLTLQEIIKEYQEGKELWAYSTNPETGEIVPGPISWAGVTRKNAETVVLTLDSGEKIICTPDHGFPVQGKGKGKVEAKDLTENDSLWPFNTREAFINEQKQGNCSTYTQVYNPKTKGWVFVHRMVANYMKDKNQHNEFVFNEDNVGEKKTIHHINFDAHNNNPSNLTFMTGQDHSQYHLSLNVNQEVEFVPELFERFEEIAHQDLNIKFKELMAKLNNDNIFMSLYSSSNKPKDGTKFKLKTSGFRQKMFLKFIKHFGYEHWRDYRCKQIQNRINTKKFVKQFNGEDVKLLQFTIDLIKNVSVYSFTLVNYLKENTNVWNKFVELYQLVKNRNLRGQYQSLTTPESHMFERVAKMFGYKNFKHLVNEVQLFNHRVIKIEKGPVQDTGTLTIDKEERYHCFHNFALKVGVTTCNSEDFFFAQRADGRGSKVETLPGGQGLGELSDLEYFQKKVWRGLRIPSSYMTEGSEGAMFNDGKVGVAYIQELRFAFYIMRLQTYVECIIDKEFKNYLRRSNIRIDESIYKVRLPDPTNFGTYRQQEVDSALLGTFAQADAVPYLSKRFVMGKYLQLEDEEMIMNERLRREELGLDPDATNKDDLQVLYGQGAVEPPAGAAGALPPAGEVPPMTAGAPGEVGAPGAAPPPGGEAGGAPPPGLPPV